MGLQNLTHIHTGRNTQRVQNNINSGSVLQVRHVFNGEDAGNHTLVSVSSSHLVADLDLSLDSDVDLDQLDDARRKLVALAKTVNLVLEALANAIFFLADIVHQSPNLLLHSFIILNGDLFELLKGDAVKVRLSEVLPATHEFLTGPVVKNLVRSLVAAQNSNQLPMCRLTQHSDLAVAVTLDVDDAFYLDGQRTSVLLDALAGEDLSPDHGSNHSWWHPKRSVADVTGLLTENGPQELLFWRQLCLTLGSDLADQDVALPDLSANLHDSSLVEVAEGLLSDVGNVARDLFLSELGIASCYLELFNVNGRVVIIANQAL